MSDYSFDSFMFAVQDMFIMFLFSQMSVYVQTVSKIA